VPEIYETIPAFRAVLDRARAEGSRVGVVPTMGFLHEGHASLMRRASAENETAALTIFVNPLQFAAHEDLDDYPRDLQRDLDLADQSGIGHVFVPSVTEMYPEPVQTTVSVAGITARFEGASRPDHFAGVATVVTKLLSIVGPCRAYFGDKDFQQLAVVRRLVADLSIPAEVVGCPIVRERDGLAMSSRNVYLSPAQRAAAPALHRALLAAVALVESGERDADTVRRCLAAAINAEPEAALDYAEIVDAASLEPAQTVASGQQMLVAAAFGSTRLLDNIACPDPD
jgi:pantoate--beta-alanine ligase